MANVKNLKILNSKCRDCELYRSSKHVCIQGRGHLNSDIMLIGEAPGHAEELTGKPFMGRAGQLLNAQLDKLDMVNLVYITNVCKCHPPENRKPTDLEVAQCQKYLIKEIKFVRPRIIVLLGKTAMRFVEIQFDKEMYLSAGVKPFRVRNFCGLDRVLIIPSWHPAYCLRRGEGAVMDLHRALRTAKEKACITS
jgi:DNA polymerase